MALVGRYFVGLFAKGLAAAVVALPFTLVSAEDRSRFVDLLFDTAKALAGKVTGAGPVAAAPAIRAAIAAGDGDTVKIGAPIRFKVQASLAGYGNVYVVNGTGQTLMLAENLKLDADKPVEVPRVGVTLRAAAPVGISNVVFLATADPFGGFKGGITTLDVAEIKPAGGGLEGDLKARLAAVALERWSLTHLAVKVVP